MPLRPILPCALLLVAACSSPAEVAEKTGVEPTTPSSAHASASASATGKATSVAEETDAYVFGYAWPAAVSAQPDLAARLQSDLEQHRTDLKSEAREGQADAQKNGYPYHAHSFDETWKVVTDLPGWLSLSGEWSTFSGGAHGMYGIESMVWDKRAKKALDGIELFTSPDALDAALQPALCRALDAERAKRRGRPVPSAGGEEDYGFNSCQHVKDSTVLVGSSNGTTFDRLTIYFGPYVAGPYAEGAFELDLPVDRKVIAAVRPAYRASFSAIK